MAITRSMKKGHDLPASNDNQSSDVENVPKKLSKSKAPRRRRVAQKKNVDRLTALPLELFKMIMEELIRDISRVLYHYYWRRKDHEKLTDRIDQTMNLRFVSRLFRAEITSAIFKAGRPVQESNQLFWCHLEKTQPLMISRLLLEESLARPNSDIGILALIQQSAEKLLHIQPDESTFSRKALFEAICSCIFHAKEHFSMYSSLVRKRSETYPPYTKTSFEQDVVNSCLVVASWMGDIPLMDVLESEHGPLARRTGDRYHPRFMGSVQWAAARNGHTDMIKYLQQKGCDFGQRQSNYFDSFSPLCGAVNGNHTEIFKAILPAYDRYRSTSLPVTAPYYWHPDPATWIKQGLTRKIAIHGSAEIARLFWARKPTMSERELSEALVQVCFRGRHDKSKKAAILIQAGASVDKYCEDLGSTPIEAAISAGPPELLQTLLQNGGNPNATVVERHGKPRKGYRSEPLIKALDSGKIDAMKVLLQHCKWESATKANLLLDAVNKDCLEMVKLLVSPEHFNPTSSRRAVNMGRAAVRQARADLKTEIVDVLLARGCEE
ncbi:hypothetical protein BKA80DRAFT_304605 [Phyllosticta citrichinensis]